VAEVNGEAENAVGSLVEAARRVHFGSEPDKRTQG
jgi:hypothetical protein